MSAEAGKPPRSTAFWEGIKALAADMRAAYERTPRPVMKFDPAPPVTPIPPAPTTRFVSKEPKA